MLSVNKPTSRAMAKVTSSGMMQNITNSITDNITNSPHYKINCFESYPKLTGISYFIRTYSILEVFPNDCLGFYLNLVSPEVGKTAPFRLNLQEVRQTGF